ncbi:MAG: hypothetical protein PHU25_20895 [Deltaproteobacteria bacterium]|nr:hypothetical protein [Deltaproteobacteria bacterium]
MRTIHQADTTRIAVLLVSALLPLTGCGGSSGSRDSGPDASDTGVDGGSDGNSDTETGTGPDAGKVCETSADCDSENDTKGFLCVLGDCVPCGDDPECASDSYYEKEYAICVEGMCTPTCPDHVIGCPCTGGECTGGLVCDATSHLCRDPLACADLGCADHQLCAAKGADAGADGGADDAGLDAGSVDMMCLPKCESFWRWNESTASCDPISNCHEGVANSLVDDCDVQHRECLEAAETAACGGCIEGYTDDHGTCRPVATCAELKCDASFRTCREAGKNTDALCTDCIEGYADVDGVCHVETCEAGAPASIRMECEQQHRMCETSGGIGSCGDCIAWYVEDEDACRNVVSCSDLDCAAEHRLCVEPKPDDIFDFTYLHEDDACGDCVPGYADEYGECVELTDAVCLPTSSPYSIAQDCADLHRECFEKNADSAAHCGGCIGGPVDGGYVEMADTGECVPWISCADFSECQNNNRHCEDNPTAHCTSCVTDYLEDPENGTCRPAVQCADLSCGPDQDCQEHTATEDAYCRPDCTDDQIWGNGACVNCPICGDGAGGPANGETGAYVSVPTIAGRCICETQEGFFHNESGDIGAYECDADHDGWLRESARIAMNSDDPQVVANARCEQRIIDRFVLEARTVNWFDPANDCAGDAACAERLVVQLDEPLVLYESDRNDDQGLLDLDVIKAPAYGGRGLRAEELNSLTKFCVSGADYNDNLVNDIEEWDYRDLPAGVAAYLAPFNWFSYFAELYRGWYEPAQPGESYGSYHIREKSRRSSAPDGDRVPAAYGATGAEKTFYETCALWPDPAFADDGNPTIGRDFARFGPDPANPEFGYAFSWPPGPSNVGGEPWGWDGLNFHSQFRCVKIVEPGNPALDPIASPHLMIASDVSASYKMNVCDVQSGTEDSVGPVSGSENPHDPKVACSVESPSIGQVGWAARLYEPYIEDSDYQGGCVNQVTASDGRCGVCGLGVWTCTGGRIDPSDGPSAWTCGTYDLPTGCDDMDWDPIPSDAVESFDCDDESSTSAFIFVDGVAGGDANPGTRLRPMKTIQAALFEAQTRNGYYFTPVVHGIVVTTGNYSGKVTLVNGVSILGGFSTQRNDFGDLYWFRLDDGDRTVIENSTVETGPKRVTTIHAANITEPTLLDRLTIQASVAAGSTGVNIHAIYANNADGLYLRDVTATASAAPVGADGAQTAQQPLHGLPGNKNGTPAQNNLCGTGWERTKGGHGGPYTGGAELDGEPNPFDMKRGTSDCTTPVSGCGTTCTCDWDDVCTATPVPGPGTPGPDGANAAPISSLVSGGYWASGGQLEGARGQAGYGGGGGAGFTLYTPNPCSNVVVSGGGGGAGGCGGSPGEGGEQGGSSFGLFILGSTGLTAERCAFAAGNAGTGGGGGPGGEGGNGGVSGKPDGHPEANGGDGGAGGRGGNGVGGNGGLSCGIFADEALEGFTLTSVTHTRGANGAGGSGGAKPSDPNPAPNGLHGDTHMGGITCD